MINQHTLELYIYVDGENDVPFFSNLYRDYILANGEEFVTSDNKVFNIKVLNENIVIHAFTYNAKRMGAAPTITTTIKYSECLDELFSEKVYAIFNGEKYFLSAIPSSSYSNEEVMYKHDATFVSERIALENTYFYDVVPENEEYDKPISNNSNFAMNGDIHEFATRLRWSLNYSNLDYTVIVDEGISSEDKFLSVENKFFSEVLQEAYNTYDIPYYFKGKEIHIGFTDNAINEVFRYGDSDALMSITKSNANNRTINRVTGFGSEENIPYYYPNKSPEGDIKVQLAETNTGLTNDDDIRVIDYEKFAKNIIMNQEVELFPSKQIVIRPFDFYGFFQDRVTRSLATEPNTLKNKVTTTAKGEGNLYQVSYNITNVDKKFLNDYGYLDEVMPSSISWRSIGDIRPAGVIPTIKVISSKNKEENLSKFDVKGLRVYWILEKFSTDYVDDSYHFEVDSRVELLKDEEHEYYVFPNFNDALDFDDFDLFSEGMGASTIKFEWDIDAPIDEYEVEVSFEVYDLTDRIWKSNGNVVKLDDIGVTTNGTPQVGDKFQKVLVEGSYIQPQKHLMPPIYRESLGDERFYNATNNTHFIPDENENYTEDYYEFQNEYKGVNPKEQIVQFDEIKPTIKGATNKEGLRIDMFTEFAYDENDNNETYELENGTLEYKHPIFFGKLRKLGFNLFDHALDDGEMEIHMTDGNCGACVFKIAVDEDDHKTNLVQVDADGNLSRFNNPTEDRYGDVICGRPTQPEQIGQARQQDTINNEVWIALYKDKDTFGELLPAQEVKPKGCSKNNDGTYNNDGDTFVITHINMPQAYIENAEEQLYQQLIYYMFDNNTENFKYSIKFSRIYFAEHPEILAQLDENARLVVEYDGVEKTLYISSLTYKTTENDVLPEITVELADELSISQNSVQKAANSVKSELYQALYGIDVVAQGTRVFLRKDIPDTANSPITFNAKPILANGATLDKQMSSKDYFEGAKGLSIHKDDNNNWHIETDYLHARKKFSAKEVEIQKMYHIGGAQIKSSASMVCSRVVELADSYRCYFEANDGDGNIINNEFMVGDQAYVQTFNLIDDGNGNTTNHFYWRLVEAVDANSITLSKTNCIEGSTTPMVGDHIVQLGYQGDDRPERQVAVIDAGAGEGAPYYRQYVGINSFVLPEPETQLKPNNNILTGRVTMEAGSNGLENFAEWESKQKEIDYSRNYIDNVLPDTLDELRTQIDGQVENFFEDYDPTTTNYPASEWTTDELKEAHIGDTFTNTQVYIDDVTTPNAGKSWRWLNKDGAYGWYAISDTDALKALALAQQAKDTADGKRRVFVVQPTPPYDKGDLWAGGSDLPLKRCVFSRTSGDYIETDWELADYSDKTQTVIDNGIITSGTIQLGDSDTTAKAGVTGSGTSDDSVRIWAGDGEDNKENAPFRVLQDGTMYASKGMFKGSIDVNDGVFSVDKDGKVIAENAEVRGVVQAQSGTFENGTFNNVTMNGSISSPLQAFNGTRLRLSVTGQVGYATWQRDTSKDKVFLNVQYYAWVDTSNNVFYSKVTDVYVGFKSFYTISAISAIAQTSYTITFIENAMAGNNGIDKHDNLAINVNTNEDRHISSDELDWSISNSGRIVRFVNAPFEGLESKGFAKLYAPDGKYFFEDGERYSTIAFSNQIVELLGYGDAYDFYGWIVLNRKDISTLKSYGATTKVLYQGVINNNTLTKFWSAQIEKTRSGYRAFLDTNNGIVTIPVNQVGATKITDLRGLENVNNWAVIANGATVNNLQYLESVEIVQENGREYWNCIRFNLDYSNTNHVVFQVISTADWA